MRHALTLIESTHASVWHELVVATLGTVVEVSFVLTVAAVSAQLHTDVHTQAPERPFFLAPKKDRASRPRQEQLQYVGLSGTPVAATTKPSSVAASQDASKPEAVAGAAALNSPQQVATESSRVLTEIEVDSLAERDPTSEGPAYPPELLAKQVEGSVLATFVVDATGYADPVSFVVMASTDSAFTTAVRVALPRMKFRPAVLNGRKVPQLVEQAFQFKIVKPQAAENGRH